LPHAVISGGSGFVGRFITEELLSAGYGVTIIARTRPPDGYFSGPVKSVQAELGQNFDYRPVFDQADTYVYAALDRDKDRKNYVFKNLGGAVALFKQARKAGVERAVFLSSQSVYGLGEPGIELYETDTPQPVTLEGKVKHETEKAVLSMASGTFGIASLRLARVYGPAGRGRGHKWDPLFKAYLAGKPIKSFAGSQIHGEDAARAVAALVNAENIRMSGGVFNAADMVIDRQDVLSPLRSATSSVHALPELANKTDIVSMNCDKMKRFEWRTGGLVKLGMTLDRMIKPYVKVA